MGLTDLEMIPETGAVFTVGRSRFADNVASHFFIRKDPVVSISCGDEHSAVICQTGRLFVFGSNDWGQLGLGHKNHVNKPSCVKALKPEKVTHVACGRAHTLICTGAQKIFACGSDQEGQLGRGTSAIGDFTSSPVLVYDSGVAGPRIVQIAAGSHHSLALTSDGGVFSWGSNLEGQLGLPDVSGLVNKPTKVHVPEPVKQISAGYYHSTFLTESGLVYVCGETESGKLGIDVSFSTQVAPKQMQLPTSAKLVASGGHHTVILAGNGNLYCTGSNSSGQLGLGTNAIELHTPKLLPRGALQNETITRISCGESHTAIVTESGKLFTCGDGRHGKLGLEENENNVHELTFVPRYKELVVLNVACGGWHTILVGQRREPSHTQKDMENAQMEHIQKRNSLPPLKSHINRLQNETRDENINEIIKDQLNEKNSTETTMSVQPTLEKVPENIKENMKNENENIANDITDCMNNIKKTDSPEKNSQKSPMESPEKNSTESFEKSSEEMSKGLSSDPTMNIMKLEEISKEMPINKEESQGSSKAQNENQELKEDNKNAEMKTDTENNVQGKHKSETMNNEQDSTENNNVSSAEIKKNDMENNEISNEESDVKNNDGTDNKRSSNEDIEPSSMKEQTESSNGDNIKEEASPEKQMSPSSSTPPPKPPRLKNGSGNSSNERTLSMEKENENANVDNEAKSENTPDKEAETTERKNSMKNESGSMKSSTKTGSSKSTRSRDGTEETIEIDKQNEKEENIEEEKMNNDNTQNDADVVQALPPRIGRMSKIFKSKKPQTIENGNKTTDHLNHKPKSKTCSIL
ncbi:X-linked retinitis pigmentosa GTPase regulator [Anthophora plagiata]